MTAPLVRDGGLTYVRIPGTFGVRPACPRCPWRGDRGVAAGSFRWRAWLAADLASHTRTAHQEKKP